MVLKFLILVIFICSKEYYVIMELSFNELKKRDVINIPDGRCLGRITDLRLNFPDGKLVGIAVPGRKGKRFLSWFDKTEIYIERNRIIKIGGDVILVDISSTPKKPCSPRPPKPCAPQGCPPKQIDDQDDMNFTIFPQNNGRIDLGDY